MENSTQARRRWAISVSINLIAYMLWIAIGLGAAVRCWMRSDIHGGLLAVIVIVLADIKYGLEWDRIVSKEKK